MSNETYDKSIFSPQWKEERSLLSILHLDTLFVEKKKAREKTERC